MNFLPSAKSKAWFRLMAGYGLIVWLLLIVHRFLLLDKHFDAMITLRFAVLALVISGILLLFGWFGARLVWLITTVGIIIGLGQMIIYTYRDMSGWEDLAGLLAFLLFTVGGFALGLVAEGVHLLMKWRKQHS